MIASFVDRKTYTGRKPCLPLMAVVVAFSISISPALILAAEPFEVNPLPFARNMHGTAIAGDWLYVVSGDTPNGFTKSVQRARINPDRTIGPWLESRSLPVSLIYLGNSVLVVGRHIYVCGGQQVEDTGDPVNYDRQDHNSVLYASVTPEGEVSNWKSSTPWDSTQSVGSAAISDGKHLYIAGGGGSDDNELSAKVFFASVNSGSGDLGSWQEASPLPQPVWFQSIYLDRDTIYTAGGRSSLDNSGILDVIYSAAIQADGTLSPWKEENRRLDYPVSSASACSSDKYLFLFCGVTLGGQLVERIQFATTTDEGIAKWSSVETRLSARAYSSAVLSPKNAAIYIIGGRRSTNYLDINSAVFCYPLRREAVTEGGSSGAARSGFLTLAQAVNAAVEEEKDVLIFFYSSNVTSSVTLKNSLSSSTSFFQSLQKAVPIAVDVSQDQALAKRYKVVRIPTVVIVDRQGNKLREESGLLTQQEILSLANQ